jgi:hypothetical protein
MYILQAWFQKQFWNQTWFAQAAFFPYNRNNPFHFFTIYQNRQLSHNWSRLWITTSKVQLYTKDAQEEHLKEKYQYLLLPRQYQWILKSLAFHSHIKIFRCQGSTNLCSQARIIQGMPSHLLSMNCFFLQT